MLSLGLCNCFFWKPGAALVPGNSAKFRETVFLLFFFNASSSDIMEGELVWLEWRGTEVHGDTEILGSWWGIMVQRGTGTSRWGITVREQIPGLGKTLLTGVVNEQGDVCVTTTIHPPLFVFLGLFCCQRRVVMITVKGVFHPPLESFSLSLWGQSLYIKSSDLPMGPLRQYCMQELMSGRGSHFL